MLRAIKIRLYPNKRQELKLNKVFGCYRFGYNQTLALQLLNNEIDSNEVTSFEVDFYHKNHIDWRGLIESGLVIDVTNLNLY